MRYLKRALPRMRSGDVDYSTARLIGTLHASKSFPGNHSLGVVRAPTEAEMGIERDPTKANGAGPSDASLSDYSHGNAGVLVYDCCTGEAQAFAGYLSKKGKMQIGAPPS